MMEDVAKTLTHTHVCVCGLYCVHSLYINHWHVLPPWCCFWWLIIVCTGMFIHASLNVWNPPINYEQILFCRALVSFFLCFLFRIVRPLAWRMQSFCCVATSIDTLSLVFCIYNYRCQCIGILHFICQRRRILRYLRFCRNLQKFIIVIVIANLSHNSRSSFHRHAASQARAVCQEADPVGWKMNGSRDILCRTCERKPLAGWAF